MKNFTKIVLSLVMAFGLLGGVNSVKAGKKYWSPQSGFSTWTSGTNTMTWSSSDSYDVHFIYTGFTGYDWSNPPVIDYSDYTKIHLNVANVTSGGKVQLKIASTGHEDKLIDLAEGTNDILFSDLSSDIDITKIKELSLFGAGVSDGSAVITNVYLQSVKNVVTCSGFGDEITDLSDITGGNKFVISDGTNVLYFEGNQDAKSAVAAAVPYNAYYYYTITNIAGLDLDDDGNADTDIYAINIINEGGTAFPAPWGLGNNVNFTNGGAIFSGSAQADKAKGYGTDAQYQGIWKVAYSDGNGFTFKNCSLNKYLKVNGSQDDVCYLKLYETLNFDVNTELDKEDNEASDAFFDFADATGYDADTHKFTNGGWTFASPVDMSNWDYLVITTINNASAASCKISIADNDGNSVTGNQYTGSVAGTGNDMYLDRWNHQNAIRISMDYLRANKGLDISKIKSLTFADNNGGDIVISIANVYLTDYNNTQINGGYAAGNVKRDYSATGKFGTICLPYKASCAGAVIYEIAGKTASGITLSEVTGLLEAGKPYFYVSSDEVGQNNAGAVRNVNFFRADLDTYDAASPVENNGLIGTFSAITAPTGDDIYVLSNGKLFNVDSDVTVGANKAYVDISKIGSSSAHGVIDIDFNEPTGIQTVANSQELNANNKFFNLAGQRVAQPTKGLYIVNGKKVLVK